MRNKRIRDCTPEKLCELLEAEGLNIMFMNLGYRHTQWFIAFRGHPVIGISHPNNQVIAQTYVKKVHKYPTLRGLRKYFPEHKLHIDKLAPDLFNNPNQNKVIKLSFKIKDTERISVLLDSIHGAKYFLENIAK